jgi:hypothetical protein
MSSPLNKLRIIVGGMVGQYPLGGVAFDYFHYVLGLHELGHEVYYHEDTWTWPFDPIKRHPVDSPDHTVNVISDFFATYAPALKDNWHYLLLHEKSFGMTRERFDEIAKTADVFLNVSGACFPPENLNPRCIRVFLDTDPGYNQIVMHERPAWSENVDRWIAQVRSHDRHFTYAENIWEPDCVIPRMDLNWIPTRCVVTLPQWKSIKDAPPPSDAMLTTMMSWGYFGGKLIYKGVSYGSKPPEYDRFHDLPRRVNVPLTLAVGGNVQPTEQIAADGWHRVDAEPMSLTPQRYQAFIQKSLGEWSIAKNVFVATRSGWFSCRTACYLAAARPAVVQDTAWSKFIPSGAGVIGFSTMDQAVAGIHDVVADLPRHRAAAYGIAEQYLTPQKVLAPMLEQIFHPPAPPKPPQVD